MKLEFNIEDVNSIAGQILSTDYKFLSASIKDLKKNKKLTANQKQDLYDYQDIADKIKSLYYWYTGKTLK